MDQAREVYISIPFPPDYFMGFFPSADFYFSAEETYTAQEIEAFIPKEGPLDDELVRDLKRAKFHMYSDSQKTEIYGQSKEYKIRILGVEDAVSEPSANDLFISLEQNPLKLSYKVISPTGQINHGTILEDELKSQFGPVELSNLIKGDYSKNIHDGLLKILFKRGHTLPPPTDSPFEFIKNQFDLTEEEVRALLAFGNSNRDRKGSKIIFLQGGMLRCSQIFIPLWASKIIGDLAPQESKISVERNKKEKGTLNIVHEFELNDGYSKVGYFSISFQMKRNLNGSFTWSRTENCKMFLEENFFNQTLLPAAKQKLDHNVDNDALKYFIPLLIDSSFVKDFIEKLRNKQPAISKRDLDCLLEQVNLCFKDSFLQRHKSKIFLCVLAVMFFFLIGGPVIAGLAPKIIAAGNGFFSWGGSLLLSIAAGGLLLVLSVPAAIKGHLMDKQNNFLFYSLNALEEYASDEVGSRLSNAKGPEDFKEINSNPSVGGAKPPTVIPITQDNDNSSSVTNAPTH